MADVHHTTDTGIGSGVVLGVVLALAVLALAAFVFFSGAFNFGGAATQPRSNDTNIQVNPPQGPSQQAPQVPSKPAEPAPAPPAQTGY